MLYCIHPEGKTGAEQLINTIRKGEGKRSPGIFFFFIPLCHINFSPTVAPWINVVLAAKPRAGAISSETCSACLLGAPSAPPNGRSALVFVQEVCCIAAASVSTVQNTKVLHCTFLAVFLSVFSGLNTSPKQTSVLNVSLCSAATKLCRVDGLRIRCFISRCVNECILKYSTT